MRDERKEKRSSAIPLSSFLFPLVSKKKPEVV